MAKEVATLTTPSGATPTTASAMRAVAAQFTQGDVDDVAAVTSALPNGFAKLRIWGALNRG